MLNVSSWRSSRRSQSIPVFFLLSMICFWRCIPCCVPSQLTTSNAVLWLMSLRR
uniref:Uncharacterized protein n=1 Tax=Arundo donax TaxID=35708 RepID=A0A0A9HMR8_ARUDO